MMDFSLLEEVAVDQLENFKKKETGIPRDVDFEKYLKTSQITAISGVRRSGKSTLLKQFSERCKNYYYLNFDDERLVSFDVEDFQNLMVVFQKLYSSKTIFLDEIQNIENWERFTRRIYDEGYKIFITGSNANLLSSELTTHLTGRYFKLELFPFSFKEFLKYKGVDWKKKGTKTKSNILRSFDEYLNGGGFPEFVKYKDQEYLKRIYEDILYKDILTRFGIREVKAFRELAGYLFSNFTKETSYNRLKNSLGFKSVASVKNYIEFMQESYLIFELYKYDYSLKKQFVSDKKIYAVDNGLRNNVAFRFSKDRGRLLENLVFLEIIRKGCEVYYYKGKKECDFLTKKGLKINEAIQVTEGLSDREIEKRETEGLFESMEKFKLKKGLIITKNRQGEKKVNGRKIKIVPCWKWLLGLLDSD